jgi:hypothetical protein
MQVLHWETELVNILAIEEGWTRQVKEDTLFINIGFFRIGLFGFGQIHKQSETFMEEGTLDLEITIDTLV